MALEQRLRAYRWSTSTGREGADWKWLGTAKSTDSGTPLHSFQTVLPTGHQAFKHMNKLWGPFSFKLPQPASYIQLLFNVAPTNWIKEQSQTYLVLSWSSLSYLPFKAILFQSDLHKGLQLSVHSCCNFLHLCTYMFTCRKIALKKQKIATSVHIHILSCAHGISFTS